MPPYTTSQKHQIAEFVNCTRTKESVATKVSNLYAFRTCSPLCGPFGYLETVLSGHVDQKIDFLL
jgi:hypothetical protein